MDRLVYSTDPKEQQKCPKCKELLVNCHCQPDIIDHSLIKANLRLETAGRKGKSVTVVELLPKNEVWLKTLTRDLKKACGSGGTCEIRGEKGGVIEIQGDKRDQIRYFFKLKSWFIKG